MSAKAQALTYDFFIASTVFLLVMSVLALYWSALLKNVGESNKLNFVSTKLGQASNIWFKEGVPENWNGSNVIEIGLSSNNRINQTKVNYLVSLGAGFLASNLALGMLNPYYRVINISNNQTIFEFPTSLDSQEISNIYKTTRIGIWNSSLVKIETILWERK